MKFNRRSHFLQTIELFVVEKRGKSKPSSTAPFQHKKRSTSHQLVTEERLKLP
jgi:hypothetical protein